MPRILLYIVSILSLYSCVSSRNSTYQPNAKFSPNALQADYTLLRNILEAKHPSLYWYTSRDSMNAYFNQYYNAIADSMTEEEFGWKVLAPLTDKIHCGHTSFGMSKGYNRWASNKRFASFPLYMKIWKDTMVVTSNLNTKDSILKRGTFITGINGWKNQDLIQYMFGYMTEDGLANNANYIRLSGNFPYYHRQLFGYYKKYTVQYFDSTGKEQTIIVPLYEPSADTVKKLKENPLLNKTNRPPHPSRLENMRQLQIDSSRQYATLTLNTFSKGQLRRFFRKSFRSLRKKSIPNLIVDLRSNGGGKMAASTLFTKYLSRRPFKIADTAFAVARSVRPYTKYIKGKGLNNWGLFFFTKKRADGKFHFGLWERKFYQPKTSNHFDGKLYILTNGPTFSAAALVCNDLKGQPGITLVGEETGGGWHGNSGIMIPDITLPNTKMRVRLPLFRLVQSNHMPKDGRGIQPDIYIGTSYDAIIHNYDKKMRVVLDMIKSEQRPN